MSAPSDKAVEVAGRVAVREYRKGHVLGGFGGAAKKALEAAHSPALGLDRSVCLRDVIEALEGGTITWHPDARQGKRVPPVDAQEFLRRHFAP